MSQYELTLTELTCLQVLSKSHKMSSTVERVWLIAMMVVNIANIEIHIIISYDRERH